MLLECLEADTAFRIVNAKTPSQIFDAVSGKIAVSTTGPKQNNSKMLLRKCMAKQEERNVRQERDRRHLNGCTGMAADR